MSELLPDSLFPAEPYRFHFRFEKVEPADFFRGTSTGTVLRQERRHWLQIAPERHAALLPEGIPLLEETNQLARLWEKNLPHFDAANPWPSCLALGAAWEPDYLLLKRVRQGLPCLVAGCVCFPSSWSLEEKIGRPIDSIHGPVPALNAALGSQIAGFLNKMRPGPAWVRYNWGISASAELNQHPARALPRLDAAFPLAETWLRVEHQALVALPRTNGVLFGIRIALHSMTRIAANRSLAPRLAWALRTMPDDLAAYKGLHLARAGLISFLEDGPV